MSNILDVLDQLEHALPDSGSWYSRNGKEYARKYRKEKPHIKKSVTKTYYEKHKERLKQVAKEHYERRKLENIEDVKKKALNSHLRRTYGITLEKYNSMLIEQSGVCKICSNKPSKNRLFVDHCHKTNKIRGLICITCNTTVAHFERHQIKILEYLK